MTIDLYFTINDILKCQTYILCKEEDVSDKTFLALIS